MAENTLEKSQEGLPEKTLEEKLSDFRKLMMPILGITNEEALLLGDEELDYYGKFLGNDLTNRQFNDVRGYGPEAGHTNDPDPESRRVKELFWNWLGNRQSVRSGNEQMKIDKLKNGGQ